jgi:hypothetical protein
VAAARIVAASLLALVLSLHIVSAIPTLGAALFSLIIPAYDSCRQRALGGISVTRLAGCVLLSLAITTIARLARLTAFVTLFCGFAFIGCLVSFAPRSSQFRLLLIAISSVGIVTNATNVIKVVSASSIREKEGARRQEFATAFGASLEWKGDIQHSNLSLLPLELKVGAASRKAVVERVITPFQAQLNYTTGRVTK